MGLFDEYAGCQMKIGAPYQAEYGIGDYVPLPDGVYVALEGVLVVHKGQLVAKHDGVITKWGTEIPAHEVLGREKP